MHAVVQLIKYSIYSRRQYKNVNASFVILKAQKSNETSGEITRTTGGNFRYRVAKLGSLGLVAFLLSKLN